MFGERDFYQTDRKSNLKCQCCNKRVFSRSTFDYQMFLFCFTRAKEFEPSRRAENSIPGFAPVVVSTATGRTRRAAAQLN